MEPKRKFWGLCPAQWTAIGTVLTTIGTIIAIATFFSITPRDIFRKIFDNSEIRKILHIQEETNKPDPIPRGSVIDTSSRISNPEDNQKISKDEPNLKKQNQSTRDRPNIDTSQCDPKNSKEVIDTSSKIKIDSTYEVTIFMPSSMKDAEVFVDGKPAEPIDTTGNSITIVVMAKRTRQRIAIKKNDIECFKDLLINRNIDSLTLCP